MKPKDNRKQKERRRKQEKIVGKDKRRPLDRRLNKCFTGGD